MISTLEASYRKDVCNTKRKLSVCLVLLIHFIFSAGLQQLSSTDKVMNFFWKFWMEKSAVDEESVTKTHFAHTFTPAALYIFDLIAEYNRSYSHVASYQQHISCTYYHCLHSAFQNHSHCQREREIFDFQNLFLLQFTLKKKTHKLNKQHPFDIKIK